jgi:hypothetical protein
MNTTPAEEAILKTDTRGRVLTPKARREQLLDEFERSGLSGQKFAALIGIKYQTFATWAQKRRRVGGATAPVPAKVSAHPGSKLQWLEAVIESASQPADKPCSPLVVHLPGGARVEVADVRQVAWAAALVRALEKPVASC